jgi:hypothetical protein
MKVFLLDACFVINLLNKGSIFHKEAYDFFVRLSADNDVILKISTIAIAEYAIKGDVAQLPPNIQRLAFNYTHAVKSGTFGNAYKQCLAVAKDNHRAVVLNDIKMFAQAEVEGVTHFITADHKLRTIYEELYNKKLVSFEFVDITEETCASFYREFDFGLE